MTSVSLQNKDPFEPYFTLTSKLVIEIYSKLGNRQRYYWVYFQYSAESRII